MANKTYTFGTASANVDVKVNGNMSSNTGTITTLTAPTIITTDVSYGENTPTARGTNGQIYFKIIG